MSFENGPRFTRFLSKPEAGELTPRQKTARHNLGMEIDREHSRRWAKKIRGIVPKKEPPPNPLVLDSSLESMLDPDNMDVEDIAWDAPGASDEEIAEIMASPTAKIQAALKECEEADAEAGTTGRN